MVKIISMICLEGKSHNDPSTRKPYFLPFLLATPSSPYRTLEGLVEVTRRLSRALDLPRALSLEDTVRCTKLAQDTVTSS